MTQTKVYTWQEKMESLLLIGAIVALVFLDKYTGG